MQPVTKISLLGIRLAVLAVIAYWVTIFLGTHLPTLAPVSPNVSDKTLHFTAFFGLAFLLCYITNSSNLLLRFGGIAAVCLAYAALDELTQNFVPGRTADPLDFVADALGTSCAVALYVCGKLYFERIVNERMA